MHDIVVKLLLLDSHQWGLSTKEWIIFSLITFDSQPTMEETILLGDDVMLGLPSPIIPPEIASHVLEGVDLCDGVLRNLFLLNHLINTFGLKINNIKPFCQDEIVLYQQCAEKRVSHIYLRQRLLHSEHKLGLSMPFTAAKERAAELQLEVTSLERHMMILASGIEIMERFHQRWSLHGRLEDPKLFFNVQKRSEALNWGIVKRKPGNIQGEPKGDAVRKKWIFR
ncbi:unnamed protein product [Musa banksii]